MNSYLQKTQKTVTLPSGAKATVRRRTRGDDIMIGVAPAFMVRDYRLRERKQEVPDTTPEEDLQFAKYLAKQSEVLLTRCVLSFEFDGQTFVFVAKDLGKQEPNEIPVMSVSPEDEDAIIAAINSLATGQGAVEPFPQPATTGAGSGCAGDSLRVLTDGASEAIA